MNKKLITLSQQEVKEASYFQKKCIIAFAEYSYKYKDEKNFEIFAVGLALVVSNIMGSFGIKNIDHFLDDMIETVKQIHKDVQKNSSYMIIKKGKKISEGQFN